MELASPRTCTDNRERGTYIYKVTRAKESIEYYTYYDVYTGEHNTVVKGILGEIPNRGTAEGDDIRIRVAFAHTHPYCKCHIPDEFSGVFGDLWTTGAFLPCYLGSPGGYILRVGWWGMNFKEVRNDAPIATYKHTEEESKALMERMN